MDQWLDSLSEDWVSQPRSPHSSSLMHGSVMRDSPSPSSNGSQSRIPRLKPRSASSLSIASAKELGQTSSMRRDKKADGALKEKTSSNLNASNKRQPNGQVKPQISNAASMRLRGRQASRGSIQAVPQDTVQHKSSSAKEHHAQGTPEWKRRVLKENARGDLFSPIGLEGVFKPPTVKSKSQDKPTPKKKLFAAQDFPSSPPPYPKSAFQIPNSPHNDLKKPATELPPRNESPEYIEASEDLSEQLKGIPSPLDNTKEENTCRTNNRLSSTPLGSPNSSHPELPTLPPTRTHRRASADNDSRTTYDKAERGRTFSYKTRNENISPFYISRHNTVDGHVEYAAIDMSMRRLRSQMDKLRMQQQNIPSSRSSDHIVNYSESRLSDRPLFREQMDEVTSQSLPDDLSMGTDAYATNGGFVSIRRGGYSNDGSFQRRPLSSSLLPDLDGPSLRLLSSNDEINKSTELPANFSQTKSKTPSSPPQTPDGRNPGIPSSYETPRSSGSPLKLFDKYDTFTNERLVRRLSKFEETLHHDLREGTDAESNNELPSSPSPRRRRPYKQNRTDGSDDFQNGRRISSFGDGELDDHRFSTYRQIHYKQTQQDDSSERSPQRRSDGFRFHHTSSYHSESERSSRGKHPKAWRTDVKDNPKPLHRKFSSTHGLSVKQTSDDAGEATRSQRETLQTATGKRLPYSPAKDPAPKRRRTLRSEDSEQAHLLIQHHLEMKEAPVQAVLGRKRKDALYDSDRQVADPSTMAMRQIRQPKMPTPSQLGNSTKAGPTHRRKASEILNELPCGFRQLPQEDTDVPVIDPPTQIVAGALATVALNTVQEITYGSRKASVTTADFFNEAQQIMQLIRAKGRPRSSHTTAEDSEVGQPTIVEESVVEDSTKDKFSRPPSREGSPRGLRAPTRLDARVVSHLRRFEDDQDLGLALSSSLKTLKIGKQSQGFASAHENDNDANSGAASDPPNIRIRESIIQAHKRSHSSSTQNISVLQHETQPGSQESQATSGPSTNQSNPTGSSRSSTNRMVIAPETVAHLLSDQMAGMVFDRQRQLWVKRKNSPNVPPENSDHTQSEGTEEDFFGDIPDLSVDEMEELQRVKEAVSSVRSLGSASNHISIRDQALAGKEARNPNPEELDEDQRPKTAEGKPIRAVEISSAPSKYSHFASSGPQPGTRATSWGDDAFPDKEPQQPGAPPPAASTDIEHKQEEKVEHEISIFEGRESRTPKQRSSRKHQARVVTVAFSSPLVEQMEPHYGQNDGSYLGEEESELILDDSPIRYGSRQIASAIRPTSSGSARKSRRRNGSRRLSMENQSYLARPMSRLDEQEEMSLVHCSSGNRRMSMNIVVTPLHMSRSLTVPPTSGRQSSIGFHLSPLPDFTVHQIDKPIEAAYSQVSRRRPMQESDGRLSLAAQDLVKKLTDIEPYEPYWDYIRSVNLHDRDLGTLHLLNEFCGRVEELDVSNNQIGELNGIPNSVRQLNIRGNHLSDLAAWNSLHNLQYLDVSSNPLKSLKGFQYLVHLRTLKADNNTIENLNGLEDLNGLTKLCLKNNKLRAVDFGSYDLRRLTKLDLHGNALVQVSNLQQLTALETCILSGNDLEALDFVVSVPLSRLDILDVSRNRLSFIDLAEVPSLKTLNLDHNSVASIESLGDLRQLDTLSWREQTLIPAYGFSEVQYQHCNEVRSLRLSGNTISTFAPSTPFLNLQHLELASTGLQTLSPDFGVRCPNLRVLNLNYNATRDLRPLLGIVKLQRLYLAGNRVSRLRRTAAVLDRLGKGLLDIDLRNNPLTVGFYTPQESSRQEKQIVPHSSQRPSTDDEEDVQGRDAKVYLLQPLDKESDNLSRERLDEDTKLRRRVYEMLVVSACRKLERLDGLNVDRIKVGQRDGIWERLVELGVLKERDFERPGKSTE